MQCRVPFGSTRPFKHHVIDLDRISGSWVAGLHVLGPDLGIAMELEWGADGPHATSPILMDGGWHFLLCSNGTRVTGVDMVYTAPPPALYEYGRGSIRASGAGWRRCALGSVICSIVTSAPVPWLAVLPQLLHDVAVAAGQREAIN